MQVVLSVSQIYVVLWTLIADRKICIIDKHWYR